MTPPLSPIAPDLWTDDADPHLIGGRRSDGVIIFPIPEGDAAQLLEPVRLGQHGILWSWTIQGFEPKEPYDGPKPFQPYVVAYVELPGEIIVQSRLIDVAADQLRIGMKLRLTIIPFNESRSIFAFRPEEAV